MSHLVPILNRLPVQHGHERDLMLLVQPESVQDGIVPASDELVAHVRPIRKVHARPAIHPVDAYSDLIWQRIAVLVEAIIVAASAVGDVDGERRVVERLLCLVCTVSTVD